MKNLVLGILAHVDAGKTTLSESLLYLSGKIRNLGRVDHKDAYLDTNNLEKDRGITIFSKQARFSLKETNVTLVDTPGHVDFSAEMERTLKVLDYAVLVISGMDGVQGHTRTLWKLLEAYQIPTYIFVNKMDQAGTNKEELIKEVKEELSSNCIDFNDTDGEEFLEQVAMCEEEVMEKYLETGEVCKEDIISLISKRNLFPVFFGSALKLEGVDTLMEHFDNHTKSEVYMEDFGAKVFKISRDEKGNRLTHLKVTGGKLKVKSQISYQDIEEKVNEIRLYSGSKYETVQEVQKGEICSIIGFTKTRAGEGIGIEEESDKPILEPVLTYRLILEAKDDPRLVLPKLRVIEEEEPELNIIWDEALNEISVQLMGEVQIEVLKVMLEERFGLKVEFDNGSILYKETLCETTEGVGHFEPLRHYAEVQLLLKPLPRNSGIVFDNKCSEDILNKNWQRLIRTHLEEKIHKGVLTGAPITDVKITLLAGRAHNKHTEGGDFREATYRAVRQGIKSAKSILLEPYYSFKLEIPEKLIGRAMTDIEKMCGKSEIVYTKNDKALLKGEGPVSTMRNYQQEVTAYTKGEGRLFCSLKGYDICHNADEIIKEADYDSERDIYNPTGSVFCSHGSGFLVTWDKVRDYMHLDSYLEKYKETDYRETRNTSYEEKFMSTEEIDAIMNQTFYANRGEKSIWKKQKPSKTIYGNETTVRKSETTKKPAYLIVDGYNIIFAWEDLKEIANINMDGAKEQLIDRLSNYQGAKECELLVVFDAYKVSGHRVEMMSRNKVKIIHTKEGETADHYIERFVHDNINKYQIIVATSDALEQNIVRGHGAQLLSARTLKIEMDRMLKETMNMHTDTNKTENNYLESIISKDVISKLIGEND